MRFTILFLFFSSWLYGQIDQEPAMLVSSLSVISSSAPNYTVQGSFSSQFGYTRDSIVEGTDVLWMNYTVSNPDRPIRAIIDSFTVISGNTLRFYVELLDGETVLAFPTGTASIYRPTPNYSLILEEPNESTTTKAQKHNANMLAIDAAIATVSSSIDSTIYATVYSRDTAAAAIRGEIAALAQPPFDSTDIATGGIGNTDLASAIVSWSKLAQPVKDSINAGSTTIDSSDFIGDSTFIHFGADSVFTGLSEDWVRIIYEKPNGNVNDYNAFPYSIIREDTIWTAFRTGPTHNDLGDVANAGIALIPFDGLGNQLAAPQIIQNDYATDTVVTSPILGDLEDGRLVIFWTKKCVACSPRQREGYFKIRDADGTLSSAQRVEGWFLPENDHGWFTPASFVLVDYANWLLAGYGYDTLLNGNYYNAVLMRSHDEGVTWDSTAVIADGEADDEQYEEVQFLQMSNGIWAALIRVDGDHTIRMSTSTDTTTWSTPVTLFNGAGQPAFIETSSNTGRLICITRNSSDTLASISTNKVGFVATYYVSENYGLSWSGPYLVNLLDSSTVIQNYGSPVEVEPGKIGFVWSAQIGAATKSDLFYTVINERNIFREKLEVRKAFLNEIRPDSQVVVKDGDDPQFFFDGNAQYKNVGIQLDRHGVVDTSEITYSTNSTKRFGLGMRSNGAVGSLNGGLSLWNYTTSTYQWTWTRDGNIGNLANPVTGFQLENSTVLFNGTTGALPISGAGTRLMWVPALGAFRAGIVTGTAWDSGNVGTPSGVVGATDGRASGVSTFVGGGSSVLATGDRSAAAAGTSNTVSGADSFNGGGQSNTVSSQWSGNIGGRSNTVSTGTYLVNVGGRLNTVTGALAVNAGGGNKLLSGANTFSGGGRSLYARSFGEAVFGLNGTDYSPVSGTAYNAADRIFSIGNGSDSTSRSNAFVMLKSGQANFGSADPVASARLEVTSTTRGFLEPRMTTTQRNAISSPATGLQVYNTSNNKLNYYNGTSWLAVVDSTLADATYWKLGGQTLAANANIGSTSTHRFGITTDGVARMYWGETGRWFSSTMTDKVMIFSDSSYESAGGNMYRTASGNYNGIGLIDVNWTAGDDLNLVAGDTASLQSVDARIILKNNKGISLYTGGARQLTIPDGGITENSAATEALMRNPANDSLYYNTVQADGFGNTVTQSGSDTLLNSALNYGHFQRVGDIVTFTVRIEIALVTTGNANTVYFDPPIASNFTTASTDVIGTASMDSQGLSSANTAHQRCLLFASDTDDKIGISFDPVASLSYPENRMYISASGSYIVQ